MTSEETSPLTISVLATLDPVLRASATLAIALDDPAIVTVTHDILDDCVRRTIADVTGIIEMTVTELEHACLSCSIREDVVPTLVRLRRMRRWQHAVVALPLSAEPAPLLRYLAGATGRRGVLAGAIYGGTVAAVDAATLAEDAFSDDFLADRGLALNGEDRRVVSEALAPTLAAADVIVLVGDGAPLARAHALAVHLGALRSIVLSLPAEELGQALDAEGADLAQAVAHLDPLAVPARDTPDRAGIWTMTLESTRPFHPDRLRRNIHRLADHPVRSHGHFWVATRPGTACVWDGAAGQLSVGDVGRWPSAPRTRIVVTGGGDERDTIAQAFADSLLQPHETPASQDTLDDWLDPRA